MRAVMTLSLMLLVEPAVAGVDGLLALGALGLIVILVTGVVAERLMRRPPDGNRRRGIAATGAMQTGGSVPEMARDMGLSQDAVRQMLRRPSHSGQPPYQEKLAGPVADQPREPWSISPAGVR
jgi:hypothetical protein